MLAASRQPVQDSAARGETSLIRYGVPPDKSLPSAQRVLRRGGHHQNSIRRVIRSENAGEPLRHCKRRLAQRNGHDFAVVAQVDRCASGANACAASRESLLDGSGYVDRCERLAEDALRDVLHAGARSMEGLFLTAIGNSRAAEEFRLRRKAVSADGKVRRRCQSMLEPIRYSSAARFERRRSNRFARSWAKRCTPAKIDFASRWASAITSCSVPPVSH